MKKYVNHSTVTPSKGYTFIGESLTTPGQVLSLRTIRERYSRGQSVVSYPGEYDSPLPPGYENLNRMEKLDFARQIKSDLNEMRIAVEQKEQLKAQKRREDDIKAEAEKIFAAAAKTTEQSS